MIKTWKLQGSSEQPNLVSNKKVVLKTEIQHFIPMLIDYLTNLPGEPWSEKYGSEQIQRHIFSVPDKDSREKTRVFS
jgi:hypothetical protein